MNERDKKFYRTIGLWGFSSIIIWIAFTLLLPDIEIILALISALQIFTFVYVWTIKNPKEENKD